MSPKRNNLLQYLFEHQSEWRSSQTPLKRGEFAKMCMQKPSNMSKYLNQNSTSRVSVRAIKELFAWPIEPLMEVENIPEDWEKVPQGASGIYVFYDSAGSVLYIGKSETDLRQEIKVTLKKQIPVPIRFGPDLSKEWPKISLLASKISVYKVDSKRALHNLEVLLLRIFINQTHNKNIGKFK